MGTSPLMWLFKLWNWEEVRKKKINLSNNPKKDSWGLSMKILACGFDTAAGKSAIKSERENRQKEQRSDAFIPAGLLRRWRRVVTFVTQSLPPDAWECLLQGRVPYQMQQERPVIWFIYFCEGRRSTLRFVLDFFSDNLTNGAAQLDCGSCPASAPANLCNKSNLLAVSPDGRHGNEKPKWGGSPCRHGNFKRRKKNPLIKERRDTTFMQNIDDNKWQQKHPFSGKQQWT